MDNSVIAKSGWLYKKGATVGWDKNWIELYRDGYLKYYESDHSPNAEDVVFMPTECVSIRTGSHVERSIQPPDGHSSQCLFSVTATNNKVWTFCGETLDDMRAWQLALEQARLLIVRSGFSGHRQLLAGSSLTSHLSGLPLNLPGSHPLSGLTPHLPCYPPPYGLTSSSSFLPAFSDGSLTYVPAGRPSIGGGGGGGGASTQANSSPVYPSFPTNIYAPTGTSSSGTNGQNYLMSYNPTHLQNLYSTRPSSSLLGPSVQQVQYSRADGRADLAMGMLGATAGPMMWTPYLSWW